MKVFRMKRNSYMAQYVNLPLEANKYWETTKIWI